MFFWWIQIRESIRYALLYLFSFSVWLRLGHMLFIYLYWTRYVVIIAFDGPIQTNFILWPSRNRIDSKEVFTVFHFFFFLGTFEIPSIFEARNRESEATARTKKKRNKLDSSRLSLILRFISVYFLQNSSTHNFEVFKKNLLLHHCIFFFFWLFSEQNLFYHDEKAFTVITLPNEARVPRDLQRSKMRQAKRKPKRWKRNRKARKAFWPGAINRNRTLPSLSPAPSRESIFHFASNFTVCNQKRFVNELIAFDFHGSRLWRTIDDYAVCGMELWTKWWLWDIWSRWYEHVTANREISRLLKAWVTTIKCCKPVAECVCCR